MTAITYMERMHKDPLKLTAEWRKMATTFRIEIEEDPDLAAERDQIVDERLRAMLGITD